MTALMNFQFEGSAVRVVEIEKEPWFAGKDVCSVLGLLDHKQALERLDEDERKGVEVVDPLGRDQTVVAISEPGVYRLIFTSRKPAAERFKRWLAHDVLPAIRETGKYEAPGCEALLSKPSHDLRPDEIMAWTSAARAVERIYGRRAAALFWTQTPLPQVTEIIAASLEVDPIGRFKDACVSHQPGSRVQARDMYIAYAKWCHANSMVPFSETRFGRVMKTKLSTSRSSLVYYMDVALLDAPASVA